MGEHMLAMRRRGLSAGTIGVRRYAVMSWLKWLELHGVGVFDADFEHVERFLDAVPRKPASRAGTTSHLHMFYKWARAHRLTDTDPTELVERPRSGVGLPRPIHATDLQLALMFAQEGPKADPRTEVALLLAAVSGLRCCELARLRWEDISGAQARVMGKGSKERVVPLNAETVAALERIERTSPFVLDGWQGRPNGEPGERASVRLAAHFRRTGATGSAHRLRHRAATEALRKCHDLRKVQTLLGHASVATTAIYTKVDPSDLRDIIVDVNSPPSVDNRRSPDDDTTSEQGNARNRDFAQRRSVTVRRRP
jgi:site-specific recombinase XerD